MLLGAANGSRPDVVAVEGDPDEIDGGDFAAVWEEGHPGISIIGFQLLSAAGVPKPVVWVPFERKDGPAAAARPRVAAVLNVSELVLV